MKQKGKELSKKYILTEFFLISIILLFVFFTDNTLSFSRTLLGKFITVSLLLFFTYVNILYGICFLSLIILYYRTDFVEQLLNMNDIDPSSQIIFIQNTDLLETTPKKNEDSQTDIIISQEKITVEEEVMKPKSSKDWSLKNLWDSVNPYSTVPSIGVFSEPFSFYH
jgi:hypothetical protein